jgi:toxin YoeB
MNVQYADEGWDDFQWWIEYGQKSGLKKLLALVKDIKRNGYNCSGKLEPLKDNLSGWYSVHLDKKNRMIFKIEEGTLVIKSCLAHYNDR